MEGYGVHELLAAYCYGLQFSGDTRRDVASFLIHNGHPATAGHCLRVGSEARRVAVQVGANPDAAELAGWLHDVSAVFPTPQRVAIARQLGLEVLPEEDAVPLIVHQKLSVVLAREVFGVHDPGVLSAVGCHTTLKAQSALLDKVLFVADKIEWDQPGVPPYRERLLAALARSLDEAAFVYMRYLIHESGKLQVMHPWLRAAYVELKNKSPA